MNLAEILASALYLTDTQGNRKAIQLELTVWQEILALLERVDAEQSAIMGKYSSVPTSSKDFAQRKQEEIEQED